MVKKKVVKKGKKEHKPSKSSKKYEFYKTDGDTVDRQRRYCPKCGHGVFLAEHKNRFHCGKCSYAEFKKTETEKKEE